MPTKPNDERLEQGLNLFRQLVSGKNALRDLHVFACNDVDHDLDCECFWEQCEAWAEIDMGAAPADAPVHACGDPDCIVPHPAAHKRPPK